MNKPNDDIYLFHSVLPVLAAVDVAHIRKKDRQYGSSWKKRGGAGAFFMLARKWDRLEEFMKRDHGYDIFAGIEAGPEGEDGTVLAEIRDLRRYLANVEAEMVARGVVRLAGWPPAPERLEDAGERTEGAGGTVAPADAPAAGDSSQRAERVADAGGPIVTAEDPDDLPFPSQVRREPISATNAEYMSFHDQEIMAGTMKGQKWSTLYMPQTDTDGRWVMSGVHHEEYGK